MEKEKPIPKHIWAYCREYWRRKTTLTSLLGGTLTGRYITKIQKDNPYLSDFYLDMTRWSFNLQIYFLNSRYQQVLDIQKGDTL